VRKGEALGGAKPTAAADFGISRGSAAPAPVATADVGDDW
jgi:hypothetical protein